MGGEHLFLQPADGEDLAPQGDLTGHGQAVAHALAGQDRGDGREHGNARARAFLGLGPGRDVDVDVHSLQPRGVDAVAVRVGLEEAQGRLGRLLHDLAQLPCQPQVALAGHLGRLDEDDLAAHRRPGQPHRDARTVDPLRRHVVEPPLAQRLADTGRVDTEGAVTDTLLRHLGGRPAQHAGDLALQVADPGFSRVLADDEADRFLGELHLLRQQPVRPELLGEEELDGDLQLFVLGVAGQLEHLEPIAERRRHGVQGVGGADEEDAGEVEGDVQVVVPEVLVLLRVEHLQERRGRIAAPVGG